MLFTLSIIGCAGLIAGGLAAAFAERFPTRSAALQNWGGRMMVVSVVLLGFAFAMV